eukprot:TRINITY_DN70123_c0_g1_i2.p2 TRINITY_DN70123_c0_g1~~TRINITY_DN70123_c0_g1_i2.p2  ORF type:complete len:313 (-),score=88.91 TRINITY_DN70123_c0_g1_i2:18-956(-)
MPDFSKLVDSLVKQGSQKEANGAVLPHWINEGARIAYFSERSGEALDVIVEGISHSKQQVRFVFERDRKAWKAVSFQQIVAGNNPLRRREKKKEVRQETPAAAKDDDDDDDVDEFDKMVNSMEKRWGPERGDGYRKPAGPALGKVPDKWKKSMVHDIDDSPEKQVQDLDAVQDLDPEAPPAPPADPDPYGVEKEVAEGKLKLPKQQSEKVKKAKKQRSASSGSDDRPAKKDAKKRKKQRSASSGSDDRSAEKRGAAGKRKQKARSSSSGTTEKPAKKAERKTDRSRSGKRQRKDADRRAKSRSPSRERRRRK